MIPKDIFWRNPFRVVAGVFSCFRSSGKAYSLPLRLAIENGVGCNYNCQMCALRHLDRPMGFMTFVKFKHIYDQILPPYLNLTGYTESFLNPDIFKMIKYAKKNGSFVRIDTNASIMSSDISKQLIESGADSISISVDGSTPIIYEKICVGGRLYVALDNIKELVKIRDEVKSPLKISIAIVVQKDNVDDLANIIKKVDELGVDEINPTPVVEYDIKEFEKYTLKNCIPSLKVQLNKISESVGIAAELNIQPLYDYINDYEMCRLLYTTTRYACYMPWHNTYITWNGDVVPCCYYYNAQISFGNVFNKMFKEIWNSEEYQKFRKSHSVGRGFKICQTCRNNETFLESKLKWFRKIPIIGRLSKRRIN